MTRTLFIVLISVILQTLAFGQAKSAGAKNVAVKGLLFIGNGSASWLPKTDLLPAGGAIELQAKKLSVRLRNVDPFGLSTFPREDDAPMVAEDVYRAAPKITLNQALQTLKLNGVNLSRKSFLIGGRRAAEGDVVELAFKGEIFWAQVVEVGATQIHFRDVQRDESGTVKHDMLPRLTITSSQERLSKFETEMTPVEPAPAKQ